MSKMLNNAGEGVLWTTLNKNDQFFCYDCYLYVRSYRGPNA